MAHITASVDSSYRIALQANFELDTFVYGNDGASVKPPLPGQWYLSWQTEVPGQIKIECRWEPGMQIGAFGDEVALSMELFWIDDSGRLSLVKANRREPQRSPPPMPGFHFGFAAKGAEFAMSAVVTEEEFQRAASSSSGAFDHRGLRSTASSLSLSSRIRKLNRGRPYSPSIQQSWPRASLVRSLSSLLLSSLTNDVAPAALHLEPLPHDVRLAFTNGADLWTNSTLLTKSSPFFETLLSSGFSESVVRRSKRARQSTPPVIEAPEAEVKKDFEDSDDETDAFLAAHPPNRKTSFSSDTDELSYRQIDITQHPYSTYHSLLVYLQTGFVSFTPLTSSFPSSQARIDFLSSPRDTNPLLPLPSSPKWIYRLAHLLGLDDHQKLALDAVLSSLTSKAAAAEFFSPVALAYDELRAVVLGYMKEHWAEVKGSEGIKKVIEEIRQGASPAAATKPVELMEAGLSL